MVQSFDRTFRKEGLWENMFTYTIDQELSLKLVETGDAGRIFELTDQSRAYLRQWLPWVDFTKTPGDSLEYIEMSRKAYSEKRGMNAAILFQGQIAGIAGYNHIDWTNKTVSIGYWLGHEYQGHGIMTRAVQALTNYAILDLHLNRVEIRAAMENAKSRSIPERLGYTYEGCIRQNEWLYDHYVDHAVYGMLADEWTSEEARQTAGL